jgi:GntR family transcriptional regulator / MocR family aminotransferase
MGADGATTLELHSPEGAFRRIEEWLSERGFFEPGAEADRGGPVAHLYLGYGLSQNIRRTAARYRARRDRLVADLAAHLPRWSVSGTAAGLHLVAHLPAGSDEDEVAELAQRCGLDARPLHGYAARPLDRAGLVIAYGHQTPDALSRSILALARRAP